MGHAHAGALLKYDGDPDQNLVSLAVTFDVFKMTLLKIVILMYYLETNIVNIYQDRMLN